MAEFNAEEIATEVCREVAELPDRNSPEDWPEAMLVTADELRSIVLAAIATNAGEAAPVAGRIMAKAHALCPTDMPHLRRMDWMAEFFLSNYAHPPEAVHGQSASTEVYLLLRNSGGASKRETVLGVFGTKAAADAEMERVVEAYHEEFPGYRQYGDAPFVSWSVRRHEVLATPPAAIPAGPLADDAARGQEVDEATAMKGGRWVSAHDIEHMTGELLSLVTGDPYTPTKMVDAFQTLRAALAQPAPVQQEAVPPMPPTDDPQPSHLEGYDEPPDEWVSRNIETVRWMMDNHHAIRAALQPTQGAKGGV